MEHSIHPPPPIQIHNLHTQCAWHHYIQLYWQIPMANKTYFIQNNGTFEWRDCGMNMVQAWPYTIL